MRTIQQMAKYLEKQLVEKGFIIQRLDAQTTKSVYLKLDLGLCNSIRISDHSGKKEYSYRYNILREMPTKSVHYFTNGKFPRNFYSFDMVDKMIEDIVARKDEQLKKFGAFIYDALMEKEKQEKTETNAFWKKSKFIGEG